MKQIILAALIFLNAILFAQSMAGKSDSIALLINGKTYNSGDTIRTENLKSLAGLQLVNKNTKQQFVPVSFEWKISLEDQVAKNQSTDKDSWQKLPDLLNKMDKNSIVYIDHIKLDIPAIVPPHVFNLIPK